MFVVKACLRDETRRFTFDGNKFPPYTEIQNKVSLVALSMGGVEAVLIV